MSLLTFTPSAPSVASAANPSDRLAGASARSGGLGLPAGGGVPGVGFSQALSQLKPPTERVTVRPGDTLSALVQKRLQEAPTPVHLSSDQLYRVALKVAADNGIANANLIYPEQRVDLSSASSWALAEALDPDAAEGAAPHALLMPKALGSAQALGGRAGGAASSSGPSAFLAQHLQAARQAQASSGIPAHFMVAQAALETGWGKQEIRFEDGRPSHNLFGIRTGANWKGPVVEITTTEFVNGTAQKMRGQFRAYASYEESFKDYARLISQSPRYANAMRNLDDPQAFASALQQGGYATAPHYASALTAVIQTTQRLQGNLPAVAAAALPSTTQMLNQRGLMSPQGGFLGEPGEKATGSALGLASGSPWSRSLSALNTLPEQSGAGLVPGSRQWRQSPYAEWSLPKPLP